MNNIDTSVDTSRDNDKTKSPINKSDFGESPDDIPHRKETRSDCDALQNEIETVMRNIQGVAR